jgi:hypothetical protein
VKQRYLKFINMIGDSHWLSLLITGFAALLVTIPWRVVHKVFYGGSLWSLSASPSGVGVALWSTAPQAEWLKFSGINWACEIDPIKCHLLSGFLNVKGMGFVLLRNALEAAIFHPISYLANRCKSLDFYWIPGSQKFDFSLQTLTSLVPIFLLFYGIVLMVRKPKLLKFSVVWLIFLVMEFAQLTFIHYESRYFMPVRFLSLGFYIFVATSNFVKIKNEKSP